MIRNDTINLFLLYEILVENDSENYQRQTDECGRHYLFSENHGNEEQ